jgi:hypothetical protein
MAFDKSGKYHMNPHHAKMADKPAKEPQPEKGEQVATETSGEEGPGEMLQALHEKMGGKHMHVHAHDAGVTTHHVGEDGMVEGPHEHTSMEEAASHIHQVMSDGMDEHQPMDKTHPSVANNAHATSMAGY